MTWLPWAVFAGLWAALNLVALTWMAGPALAGLLLVVPGSPVIDEVGTGNIHLMLGAAIALSFRWPAAWALPLLTKVTPGVGVLWLAGARRWRSLAIALGATAAIVLVSFVLAPQLWFDWLNVLTGNVDRADPERDRHHSGSAVGSGGRGGRGGVDRRLARLAVDGAGGGDHRAAGAMVIGPHHPGGLHLARSPAPGAHPCR